MMSNAPMIRVGDVIENPVAATTIVFLQTGAETNGALLQMDVFVRPSAFVHIEHIHPHQAERFVLKQGMITMQIDGVQHQLTPGADVTVPAKTPHAWWTSGDEEVHMLLELRPAGLFAEYFTTLYALAQAGMTDINGAINPVRYAVIDRAYGEVLQLTKPSRTVQKAVFGLLYPLGRLLGYPVDYPYRVDAAHQHCHRLPIATNDTYS